MGAIRLFLACGVVLAHFHDHVLSHVGLSADMRWAFNLVAGRAVVFFYIVSGFLISYILEEKYPPGSSGTLAFFRSRFLRIYPLWWCVLLLILIVPQMTHTASPLAWFFSAVLIGSDWILMFWTYPEMYWPLFPHDAGVGWTLAAELDFYLLAPWLLRSNRIALTLLAASAALQAIFYWKLGPSGRPYIMWSYFFFPSTLMYFLLGHFARRVYSHQPSGTLVSVTLLLSAAALSFYASASGDWRPPYLSTLCFALSLPGIFAATKDNKILNFMGDLTYPLYLVHSLVISALFWPWQIANGFGAELIKRVGSIDSSYLQSMTLFGVVLAIAFIVAALVHVLIERPVRAVLSQLMFGHVDSVDHRRGSPLAVN